VFPSYETHNSVSVASIAIRIIINLNRKLKLMNYDSKLTDVQRFKYVHQACTKFSLSGIASRVGLTASLLAASLLAASLSLR
jgi:hypothetical protein